LDTKKEKEYQKTQFTTQSDEEIIEISDEIDENENDLSFLNQPTLVIVKNRKRIRKKHNWAIPL
jgi:hypothetical protein